MFYVGQEVECIDDTPDLYGRPFLAIKGRKYTLTCVIPVFGGYALYLAGIFNDEAGYWSKRFRPIQKKKTDISIFTEMLTPKQLEEV